MSADKKRRDIHTWFRQIATRQRELFWLILLADKTVGLIDRLIGTYFPFIVKKEIGVYLRNFERRINGIAEASKR